MTTLSDGASPAAVSTDTPPTDDLECESITLVRKWLAEADGYPVEGSAAQLAGVLRDPAGLAFTLGFVDGVVRPEDLGVAARTLREIAPGVPHFLPAPLRGLVRVGGMLAPAFPWLVVPAARAVLRRMVGHLIVDATDAKLGPALTKIRGNGVRLNINLLGEAVLGTAEAARRLAGTRRLLERDDVDYVSIKVSATIAPHAPWAFDAAVEHIAEQLTPLFTTAASASTPKFINLDMEEYKDLELTMAVFTRLLDRDELLGLEAGIVLQAYLPDALSAMQRLQDWAAARRARGGAGIKVRLVKGANLPMEQVEASLHGWPLATWGSKQDSDTNYKRVLDWAMTPERTANIRLGVAGHNLFDVAHAWLLAGERGVRDRIEFEMLLGMAQGQAEAVRREVGGLLLYTPVVSPQEFDVAIAYLVRRLEEGASSENFMSAVFELSSDHTLFEREQRRFQASLSALDTNVPAPNRTADRFAGSPRPRPGVFANTPDTDPSVPANRDWAKAIYSAVPGSRLGIDATDAARIDSVEALDATMATAVAAGTAWHGFPGAQRSSILHAVGDALEAHRAQLIEVMIAEAGKTFDQADPEVSEAVDFAHFYAESARELDAVDGARFEPATLTLVTPPWNFPVAIVAGSTLAPLAAGSAVVLKPAPPAERCGAVVASIVREALDAAGAPADLLTLALVDERTLGRRLVAHSSVDRVILTGAYETAELFRGFRPDLPLLAETSGKNAIIVTPSADLDLAARDVVASAFGHAGQKCSAASLVVLVGSVGSSRRFLNQVLDAARSLVAGMTDDPTTQLGPVIEQPGAKLLSALTELGAGESWLLQPRRLDDIDPTGRLWTPGIRSGVRRGSAFHRTEYFGPVLGIMTAATLDEAIDIVNEVDYGLTSGLHSLDRDELDRWLRRIQAGNLYVNRGITGAIVRRQPFGGWKRSAVGPGTKAGGPNYLIGLGDWTPAPAEHGADVASDAVSHLLGCAASVLPGDQYAAVRRGARSDAAAWAAGFGTGTDVSGLSAERNVFRYLPFPDPVHVRFTAGRQGDLVRIVAAGLCSGARLAVSLSPDATPDAPLVAALREAVGSAGSVDVETDDEFHRRVGTAGAHRVRLIGVSPAGLVAATGGRPDIAVWAGPVLESGRIELLPFLREQAVSITAHRFGTPNGLSDGLI